MSLTLSPHFRFVKGAMNIIDLAGILPYSFPSPFLLISDL
jgi:hypothetical protein